GGNFGTAVPDSPLAYRGLSDCEITVHVSTKLNRTHLYPGRIGLVLPCFGRTDIDAKGGIEQFISVEDSMSTTRSSHGIKRPESEHMRSEPAIVAAIGHSIASDRRIDWLAMAKDYDLIRNRIERCQEGVF